MGLTVTREVSAGGVPVFQVNHTNAIGGFTLDTTGLTAGALVPAGTVMGIDEANRKAKVLKVAEITENAIASVTAFKVKKGHLFIVGDYIAKTVGGTAYPITVIDTINAGYDIISFDSLQSKEMDRFIEVKSFSRKPEFYWSKNELTTSELKRKKYYLYLVDRSKMDNPQYQPIIIQDPYNNVFHNTDWKKDAQNWLVNPSMPFKVS